MEIWGIELVLMLRTGIFEEFEQICFSDIVRVLQQARMSNPRIPYTGDLRIHRTKVT